MKLEIKTESNDEITLTLVQGRNGPYISLHVWDDYEGIGGSTILYKDFADKLIQALTDLRKEM